MTPDIFADAETLMQVSSSAEERAMMAASWRTSLAPSLERRVGPRKVAIPAELSPATVWNPAKAVSFTPPTRDRFVRAVSDNAPLPSTDADIAYAPVSQLSRWIERKQLTSQRLTQIYLDRIAKYDPQLRCVITVVHDHALAHAKAADAEIATGKYRGP